MSPEAATALAQAGPVAILLVFIAAVCVAFVRGTIVPGYLYEREREQRLKAETDAEANLAAIKEVTATVKAVLDERRRA